MSRRATFAVLLAILATALTACGGEPSPTPDPAAPQTIYVRAEGMVKKLGIT